MGALVGDVLLRRLRGCGVTGLLRTATGHSTDIILQLLLLSRRLLCVPLMKLSINRHLLLLLLLLRMMLRLDRGLLLHRRLTLPLNLWVVRLVITLLIHNLMLMKLVLLDVGLRILLMHWCIHNRLLCAMHLGGLLVMMWVLVIGISTAV